MLTVEQLQELKRKMADQILELSKQSAVDCEIDIDGDEVDISQGSYLNHLMTEQMNRNKSRLCNLLIAFGKFAKNEYGCCEECGEDIGYKRLSVCLEAKLCISCAEIQEKTQKDYKC
jgi:DnaK suppressor protein